MILEKVIKNPFHHVFQFPLKPTVFDFEKNTVPFEREQYGIGKYGEYRPGLYTEKQYLELGFEPRDMHLGIDLFGKVGDEVFCPEDSKIVSATYRSQKQDYGAVIIVQLLNSGIYALFGHLSLFSLEKIKGQCEIKKGTVIGYLGQESENGGWAPHLHFQLGIHEPIDGDMPGVIRKSRFPEYSRMHPDPESYFRERGSQVWKVNEY